MGEYARHNGRQVKIGTCEDLYYVRIEDSHLLTPERNNVDAARDTGIRFRLPFPDEDNVQIGHYEDYNRGYRLYRSIKDKKGQIIGHEDFNPDWLDEAAPGSIQLTHPSGLLLNVPCHHGRKLPDLPGAHWNGKSHSIELFQVKRVDDGVVVPIVGCRHCGQKWRTSWDHVLPFVGDEELHARLSRHAIEEFA